MNRLLLLTAFILTVLFAGSIGLIRAHPYNDSELRAFLAPPEGCPMPCWMGIRPRKTPITEAVSILERHPWIGTVTGPVPPYDPRTYWTWSDPPPPLVNPLRRGRGRPGWDYTWSSLEISTYIPMGDLLLSLGKPDRLLILIVQRNLPNARVSALMHVAIYEKDGLRVSNIVNCPASMNALLNTSSTISFGDVELRFDGNVYESDEYALPRWFFSEVGCAS